MQLRKGQKGSSILSEIICLICTFSQEIEMLKQKMVGFPQFSPQDAFKLIDKNKKGYITTVDLYYFLDQKIEIEYIHAFLVGIKDPLIPKMSYLQFLKMIRPYYDRVLADDLLNRATKNEMIGQLAQMFEHYMLLECILISELEKCKERLSDEYAFNHLEIKRLLPKQSDQKSIVKFVKDNGYEIQQEQAKYLKSFLREKPNFQSQTIISRMFLKSKKPRQVLRSNEPTQTTSIKTAYNTKANFLDFKIPSKVIIEEQHSVDSIRQQLEQKNTYKPILKNLHKAQQIQNNNSVVNIDSPILDQFINLKFVNNKSQVSFDNKEINKSLFRKSEYEQSFDQSEKRGINSSQKPLYIKPTGKKIESSDLLDNFLKKSTTNKRQEFNDSLISASKQSESILPFHYY